VHGFRARVPGWAQRYALFWCFAVWRRQAEFTYLLSKYMNKKGFLYFGKLSAYSPLTQSTDAVPVHQARRGSVSSGAVGGYRCDRDSSADALQKPDTALRLEPG
jgi:hypothetical protein